jgi:hypothetical protein
MEPMRFERNVLDQTDEELGVTLVAYWVSINANRAGIKGQEIPDEFAAWLIRDTARRDGESVEFAALQSIYRKACSGDFAAAGCMFREWVESNERYFDLEGHAQVGIRVAEGRKTGGRKSGITRKNEAANWHAKCLAEAQKMLAAGTEERNLASVLALRFRATWGKSDRQVRNVLQKAGVLKKRK